MMSLEEIFLQQAVNLDSRIDSIPLRQLLRLENGKYFDSQLCDELVIHFGNFGTVNFSDFASIWSLLKKRRVDFDQFSYRGQLCAASFQMLLEQTIQTRLHSEFVRKLIGFYGQKITFDSYVHAVHHIKNISISLPICPEAWMKKFRDSVQSKQNSTAVETEIEPSAPPEEILPITHCTYI